MIPSHSIQQKEDRNR